MHEKIVVPLDGSELAECVLPHVEDVAGGDKTREVILVSITEPVVVQTSSPEMGGWDNPPSEKVTMTVGKKERQAQRYLDKVAKKLDKEGIKVRTKVLIGNPAEEITSFTESSGADLIIMASHGRSGPSRWTHGSVAEKVFRASCVPILMVRAPGCGPIASR